MKSKRKYRTGAAMTSREVAKRLGISHARVMQIEKAALRKLRGLLDGGAL